MFVDGGPSRLDKESVCFEGARSEMEDIAPSRGSSDCVSEMELADPVGGSKVERGASAGSVMTSLSIVSWNL
jgi:hypothetical protein